MLSLNLPLCSLNCICIWSRPSVFAGNILGFGVLERSDRLKIPELLS